MSYLRVTGTHNLSFRPLTDEIQGYKIRNNNDMQYYACVTSFLYILFRQKQSLYISKELESQYFV